MFPGLDQFILFRRAGAPHMYTYVQYNLALCTEWNNIESLEQCELRPRDDIDIDNDETCDKQLIVVSRGHNGLHKYIRRE